MLIAWGPYLYILAQADPTSGWQAIQAGGTAGLILVLGYAVLAFVRGWVVAGRTHERELASKDLLITQKDARIQRLEDEAKEQALFFRDQAIPALTRTQDVMVKSLEERAWQERSRRPPS